MNSCKRAEPPADITERTRQQNNATRWIAKAPYLHAPGSLEEWVRATLDLVKDGSAVHNLAPPTVDVILATARVIATDVVLLDALRNAGQILDAVDLHDASHHSNPPAKRRGQPDLAAELDVANNIGEPEEGYG